MTLYSKVERVLKSRNRLYLKTLEKTHSIEIRYYRHEGGLYSEVYGMESGETWGEVGCFQGMITGDTFFPASMFGSGSFERGFLFSSSDLPHVGGVIEVSSQDGRSRRFKIESKMDLGTTTDVFTRFDISAMGD